MFSCSVKEQDSAVCLDTSWSTFLKAEVVMTSRTCSQVEKKTDHEVDLFDAAQLTFSPGTRALVENLSGGGCKCRVEIVGVKRQQYILFHYSRELSGTVCFEENASVLVRSMCHDHHLCGYKTTVIKILKTPVPLLILRYPEQFEAINMRQYDRIQSVVLVEVFYQGHDYSGVIINLSRGGCRLVIRTNSNVKVLPSLKPDDDLFLIFTLPGENQEFYVAGQCRVVTPEADRYSIGVQFMHLSDKKAQAIDDYVLDLKGWLKPELL